MGWSESTLLQFEPVELIYAALLFEYVDVPSALAMLRRACRPGGVMASVLQLPGDERFVSPSPYASLGVLAGAFRFVEPAELARDAARAGFTLQESATVALSSGKRFELQSFR